MTEDNRESEEKVAVVKKVERVYEGFLNIDKALVSHSRYDGERQTVTRLSMERGDAVSVLIVNKAKRTVWLLEQFRYPTLAKGPGWILELPAGMPQPNETHLDAAHREIKEETGFSQLDLEHISTFYVSPGGTSERIVLYAAFIEDQQPDKALSDEIKDAEEDILMVETDLDEFINQAILGQIDDAKTLIGALWLAANRDRLEL